MIGALAFEEETEATSVLLTQSTRISECLVANVALKRLFLRMNEHMLV